MLIKLVKVIINFKNMINKTQWEKWEQDNPMSLRVARRLKEKEEDEAVCPICNGTGYTEELVYTDGEMDGYKEVKCECKIYEENDDFYGGDGQDD